MLSNSTQRTSDPDTMQDPTSYFQLSAYSGLVTAHIAFMVVAWVFVLPIGKSKNHAKPVRSAYTP